MTQQTPQARPPRFPSKDADLLEVLTGVCFVGALLGLIPWPYGYYMLLRTAFCGSALVVVYTGMKRRMLWTIGYLGLAYLYNPIVPVHLGKGTKLIWVAINLATCYLLLVGSTSVRETDRQADQSKP